MRKFILAITAVALMAMPAFASVQNIKVKGSIDNTYLYRANFDFGATANDNRFQSIFISQTTVGVDADLSDNVSATVGLINERAWDEASSSNTDVDLYLAYVTLREMLYSPLTVVVGRQSFHYGNSFVFDSSGTNNSAPSDSNLQSVANDLTKQTTLDAFRAILDYNPLTLEFFYAKADANTLASTTDDEANNDDTDVFGTNATWEVGDAMKTQVEGYFFARVTHGSKSGTVVDKNDTVFVPGLRASTNPIEGLNLQAEFAWQRGTKVQDTINTANDVQRREAYGTQLIANYQVPVLQEYKPVAQYVYTWVSGDSNYPAASDNSAGQSSSEKYTAWDPFYENQAGGKIYNTLYNLSNAHIHTASLAASPMEDLTLTGSFTALIADKETQCGSNSLGCSASVLGPDGSKSVNIEDNRDGIGQEYDVDAVYNYTEDVQIGATVGWFVPGDIYHSTNDQIAKQAIVHANVNF